MDTMPRHGKDRGRPAPRARQSSAAARDILPVGCLSPRMGTFPEARELAALGARPLESITVRLRSGRASLHARARTPALPAGPAGTARPRARHAPTGNPYALARGLLDHGSILVELGRSGEAASALQEARSLFAELRATPWLERTERALAPLVVA